MALKENHCTKWFCGLKKKKEQKDQERKKKGKKIKRKKKRETKEKKGKKRKKKVWSFLDCRKVRSTDQHPHFQGSASSDRVVSWFPVQGWPMSSWQGARPKDLPSLCETPRRCTSHRLSANSSLYSRVCSLNRKKINNISFWKIRGKALPKHSVWAL